MHLALAYLLDVFIAADASTWVRDLGLKAQLCWKDRSSLRRENCLPSHPSGSFSIHHPSATSPRSTNKGLTGASCALRAPGHRVAVPLHPLPQRAAPDSARCSLTRSGCSWWPSKALEQIQMGPRGPEKAQYPEWEYQASDWPSVSGWMTVRMTTFYHYFYVSPAPHSCLNTQKNDSIWRFCCAQGLNNPSSGDGPELILLLKLVPIQGLWVGAVATCVLTWWASDQLPQNT